MQSVDTNDSLKIYVDGDNNADHNHNHNDNDWGKWGRREKVVIVWCGSGFQIYGDTVPSRKHLPKNSNRTLIFNL